MAPKPLQLVKSLRPPSAWPRIVVRARLGRSRVPPGVHMLVPIVIGVLWAFAIQGIRLRDMTDLGLISVMPVSALVLLALLTLSFCLTLKDRPMRQGVAFAHVVVLIVILYGVTAFIQPEPRIASVYRHVGIIANLIGTGEVDPSIDAYFNWPGFFALGALFTEAAGLKSPMPLAAWGPLVFNLLFLAPLLVIFRWASDDPRVWWLGLWVYFSANWVGQDYLSPQAVAFTLWLAILAALLTWFTPRPPVLARRPSLSWAIGLLDVRRIPDRLRAERDAAGGARVGVGGIVLTVVLIFAAIVSGHQLTPFAIIFTVGGLVLFAGLRTRRLPIIMVVLLTAWISYQTTTYLTGHIDELSGSVGSTSQNLSKNVTGRVAGSSEHAFIVQVRIAGTALIWLLAMAGAARRLGARRIDIAFMVIGAAPLILPILQPYGGEMLLRVFFFSLPVVAFFIAALAFPTPRAGRGRPTIAAVAILCVALLGLFQFTRYGNERLDHFTRGDAAAVDTLYRVANPGSMLVGAANLPWKFRGYADYDYRSIFELQAWRRQERPAPAALVGEIARTAPPNGAYVIVTRSMKVEASLLNNKPGVLEDVVILLRGSSGARQLFGGPDGVVFHVSQGGAGPGSDAAPLNTALARRREAERRAEREFAARRSAAYRRALRAIAARRAAARRAAARRKAPAIPRTPVAPPAIRPQPPAPPPALPVRPPPPPALPARPLPAPPPPPPAVFDDSG